MDADVKHAGYVLYRALVIMRGHGLKIQLTVTADNPGGKGARRGQGKTISETYTIHY